MAVTAAGAAAIVLTAGVLTACGSSPGSPPSGVSLARAAASVPASAPRTLSETGSSLMAPLFTLWAPAYHARFPQVTLHAQAYPIINYEYAVVNASQPSATRAQDLRAFLTWAVTSGTAQLAKVHFQPLPPSVITLSDAQIARIKG